MLLAACLSKRTSAHLLNKKHKSFFAAIPLAVALALARPKEPTQGANSPCKRGIRAHLKLVGDQGLGKGPGCAAAVSRRAGWCQLGYCSPDRGRAWTFFLLLLVSEVSLQHTCTTQATSTALPLESPRMKVSICSSLGMWLCLGQWALLVQAFLLNKGSWLLCALSLELGSLVYSSASSSQRLSAEKWRA